MTDPESLALTQPDNTPPATAGGWFWQAIRLVQVRARFLIVLAVIGLVVGQWERLSGYWNWATRLALGSASRQSAVSPDTEFFCPMDPGVLSPWEDKCPICHMTLVRRKKGDAQILPEGVVARMQVSPQRLQLAGVKTSTIEYRPLVHEIAAKGFVREVESQAGEATRQLHVVVPIAQRDLSFLRVGQAVEARLANPELAAARAALLSLLAMTDSQAGTTLAALRLENPDSAWRPGSLATIVIRTPLADVEPYRSLAKAPPAIRPNEPRVAFISREHPEIVRTKPGRCPIDQSELVRVELIDNQRLDYWCPMHPEVFHAEDGHECAKCNGMKLLPRIVSFAPPGHVLAVPASAVLDIGGGQLVYVEVAPGMLEAWQVRLGTRVGEYYPVLSGLAHGNRVVAAGAFLLDAETRLSGQASTAYFGAATPSKP